MGICAATTGWQEMNHEYGQGRGKPPRLNNIFSVYDPPLYFVTVCCEKRMPFLNNDTVHNAFRTYAMVGRESYGIAVGQYVIMPDHLHLFIRGTTGFSLSLWVRGLKRSITTAVRVLYADFRWQRGFFDHLLRNTDSYSQKWHYVEENPIRAGLVAEIKDWPYAGEIVRIDRV